MGLHEAVIRKKGNKYIVRQNRQYKSLGVKIPMPNAPDIKMELGEIRANDGTIGIMPKVMEYPVDKYTLEDVMGHVSFMNEISDNCPNCKDIERAIKESGIKKGSMTKADKGSIVRDAEDDRGVKLIIPPLLKRKTLRELILDR